MHCRIIGLLVSVLGLCAGLCSISCAPAGQGEVKPIGFFKDISNKPAIYKPSQLFDLLGFSLEAPHQVGVIDILAATCDKDQPKTVANKYSVNDLLAMNEVYESDFTPERFKEKLAFCESLSPHNVEPKSGFAFFLMRRDRYNKDRKTYLERKQREPQEFVFYKNLYEYCMVAFDHYHNLLRRLMRVDDDLDRRAKQLEDEVGKFRQEHLLEYKFVNPGDYSHARDVMVDFMKGKQAVEVSQINSMCSELIDKVGFVAERELHRYKWAPIRYRLVFTYCKMLS